MTCINYKEETNKLFWFCFKGWLLDWLTREFKPTLGGYLHFLHNYIRHVCKKLNDSKNPEIDPSVQRWSHDSLDFISSLTSRAHSFLFSYCTRDQKEPNILKRLSEIVINKITTTRLRSISYKKHDNSYKPHCLAQAPSDCWITQPMVVQLVYWGENHTKKHYVLYLSLKGNISN